MAAACESKRTSPPGVAVAMAFSKCRNARSYCPARYCLTNLIMNPGYKNLIDQLLPATPILRQPHKLPGFSRFSCLQDVRQPPTGLAWPDPGDAFVTESLAKTFPIAELPLAKKCVVLVCRRICWPAAWATSAPNTHCYALPETTTTVACQRRLTHCSLHRTVE